MNYYLHVAMPRPLRDGFYREDGLGGAGTTLDLADATAFNNYRSAIEASERVAANTGRKVTILVDIS